MLRANNRLLWLALLGSMAPFFVGAGCSRSGQNGLRPAATSPSAAGGGAAATSQPAGSSVSIDNFSFNPPTITVIAGATVVWVNHDDAPHTVTANDKSFGSKALDTDDRFAHRFAAPGTYPYFCAVHTHMTGQVIVKSPS